MGKNLLSIDDLKVSIDEKEILKGIDLQIGRGEIHIIMGPNGSGKSTVAYTLMGHPEYQITDGEIEFEGEIVNDLRADER
ncbi:MAG TPA: ATP-binding cassette domain-containing protein, partial [Tepidimicrobium sp.]|nr:ATP-binding cassette domain-containing protein [Tepidimicrobium sp.]